MNKERLIEFDQLGVLDQHLPHDAGYSGEHGGEQLHHLDQAKLGRRLDVWPTFT